MVTKNKTKIHVRLCTLSFSFLLFTDNLDNLFLLKKGVVFVKSSDKIHENIVTAYLI